jgi:hypothetical protein
MSRHIYFFSGRFQGVEPAVEIGPILRRPGDHFMNLRFGRKKCCRANFYLTFVDKILRLNYKNKSHVVQIWTKFLNIENIKTQIYQTDSCKFRPELIHQIGPRSSPSGRMGTGWSVSWKAPAHKKCSKSIGTSLRSSQGNGLIKTFATLVAPPPSP